MVASYSSRATDAAIVASACLEFGALLERAARLDVRSFERADAVTVVSGLQQPVLELLQAGRTRLAQILEDVERLSEGWSSELGLLEEPPEETVARAVDPVNAIGEIVFVASLELRLSEERLRSAGATSATTLLAECDSALRHLAKGLRAVVHAASRSREEPRVSAHVELAVSRQVRRAYARFRRRIAAAEAAPDLHSRFRAAGTQIAMLVGHEAYPRMRVRDRLVLQDLQRRILAWLRDGGIDAKAGEQLWQDLTACIAMFALVNRRQELVQHDSALLKSVLADLHERDSAIVDEALVERIHALEGLDAELDALLARKAERPREEFLRVLERLATPYRERDEEGRTPTRLSLITNAPPSRRSAL